MTTLESDVLNALTPHGRPLNTTTIAAILRRPQSEIDRAVKSLRAKRLAMRNSCGQWSAYRTRRAS